MRVCAAKGHAFHQMAVDTIREAYRRIGLSVEYVWSPTRRSLMIANAGGCDAEIMRVGGADKEFTNLIPVPVPVARLEGVAFMNHAETGEENGGFHIRSWDDLKGRRTYIILGEVFAERGTQGLEVGKVGTYKQLFELLAKGRADVGVGIGVVGEVELARHFPDSNIHAEGNVLSSTPMFHYVHKSNRHLIGALQRALEAMAREGEIERLNAAALERMLTSKK